MTSVPRLLRESLRHLPSNARRFLGVYAASLSVLSVLDAAALGLLAIVITPLLEGRDLDLPILGPVSGMGLLVLLGVACALIVVKGVLAVLVIWRSNRTFARYELEIGSRLFESYLRSSWVERLQRNSSDIVRLTDTSVAMFVTSFLRPLATLPGEVLSFVAIVVVLAIAQPAIAVVALLYLGFLGGVLYFWVTKRSRQAGDVTLRSTLRASRFITEMVAALKEVTLRDKLDEVADVVRESRWHAARARSNAQLLGQAPRYILESGLIGGFVLVGGVGYLIGGFTEAMTAIALFGVAGFRMAPPVQRFQSIANQVGVSQSHVERVLEEIERSERTTPPDPADAAELPEHPTTLQARRVTFRYAAGAAPAVRGVDLDIPFGTTAAFVGASGAGKSTMVDLLLGLVEPTEGEIAIDGVPLTRVARAWHSRIGYVPQDVALFDATVAQNVALTWTDDYDPERVRRALAQAQLLDTIDARPEGIETRIGERGLTLSGGQRQRLGIARALYADPLVLVMDEATSALDTATEAAVTDAIRSLRGSMTIITVAHRLATVEASDVIFFMRDGELVAQGTFGELVARVPDFAEQARLAGLADR